MTARAALLVAACLAACSPLEVTTDDRRVGLAPDEAARADEILSRPFTLDLDLAAAPVVFDESGVARIDAHDLDWALQGVRRSPKAIGMALISDAADGEREWNLNDADALDEALAGFEGMHDMLAVDRNVPVVLVADQQGIRWTTTFALDGPTTAALSLAVDAIEGAVVEFVLDGERVGPLRDLWRPTRRALDVELGVHALGPGEHVLDVVFLEGGAAQLRVDALVLTRR